MSSRFRDRSSQQQAAQSSPFKESDPEWRFINDLLAETGDDGDSPPTERILAKGGGASAHQDTEHHGRGSSIDDVLSLGTDDDDGGAEVEGGGGYGDGSLSKESTGQQVDDQREEEDGLGMNGVHEEANEHREEQDGHEGDGDKFARWRGEENSLGAYDGQEEEGEGGVRQGDMSGMLGEEGQDAEEDKSVRLDDVTVQAGEEEWQEWANQERTTGVPQYQDDTPVTPLHISPPSPLRASYSSLTHSHSRGRLGLLGSEAPSTTSSHHHRRRAHLTVYARVRPFVRGEKKQKKKSGGDRKAEEYCVRVKTATRMAMVTQEVFAADDEAVIEAAAAVNRMASSDPKKYRHLHTDEWARAFEFTRCFWSVNPHDAHYAAQEEIYARVGSSIVSQALFHGLDVTFFAYGASGTGKTYTLFGPEHALENETFTHHELGLFPRVFSSILEHIRAGGSRVKGTRMSVSFLEMSQHEGLRDLLTDPSSSPQRHTAHKPSLRTREHPEWGAFVEGLTVAPVETQEQLLELLQVARRAMGSAGANVHVLATAYLQRERDKGADTRVQFVDVGAWDRECADGSRSSCPSSPTLPTRTRSTLHRTLSSGSLTTTTSSSRTKGVFVSGKGLGMSTSLSALGNVLGQVARGKDVTNHRDSTLTFLTRPGMLLGRSHTYLMLCVSPAREKAEEAERTLRFGYDRVGSVRRVSGYVHGGGGMSSVPASPVLDDDVALERFEQDDDAMLLRELEGGNDDRVAKAKFLQQSLSDPQQKLVKLQEQSKRKSTQGVPRVHQYTQTVLAGDEGDAAKGATLAEYWDLKSRTWSLESELQALRVDYDVAVCEARAAKQDLERMRDTEVSQMIERVEELEGLLAASEHERTQKEKDIRELQMEVQRLRELLEETKTWSQESQQSMQHDLQAAEKELMHLRQGSQGDNSLSTAMVEQLQARVATLEQERRRLSEKLQEAVAGKRQSQEEAAQTSREKVELLKELAELKVQLAKHAKALVLIRASEDRKKHTHPASDAVIHAPFSPMYHGQEDDPAYPRDEQHAHMTPHQQQQQQQQSPQRHITPPRRSTPAASTSPVRSFRPQQQGAALPSSSSSSMSPSRSAPQPRGARSQELATHSQHQDTPPLPPQQPQVHHTIQQAQQPQQRQQQQQQQEVVAAIRQSTPFGDHDMSCVRTGGHSPHDDDGTAQHTERELMAAVKEMRAENARLVERERSQEGMIEAQRRESRNLAETLCRRVKALEKVASYEEGPKLKEGLRREAGKLARQLSGWMRDGNADDRKSSSQHVSQGRAEPGVPRREGAVHASAAHHKEGHRHSSPHQQREDVTCPSCAAQPIDASHLQPRSPDASPKYRIRHHGCEACCRDLRSQSGGGGGHGGRFRRKQEDPYVVIKSLQSENEALEEKLRLSDTRAAELMREGVKEVLYGVLNQRDLVRETVSEVAHEKHEAEKTNRSLSLQLKEGHDYQAVRRELAALWLAMSKTDMLDAAKDGALVEFKRDMDKLKVDADRISLENRMLRGQLAEVDELLLQEAAQDGIDLIPAYRNIRNRSRSKPSARSSEPPAAALPRACNHRPPPTLTEQVQYECDSAMRALRASRATDRPSPAGHHPSPPTRHTNTHDAHHPRTYDGSPPQPQRSVKRKLRMTSGPVRYELQPHPPAHANRLTQQQQQQQQQQRPPWHLGGSSPVQHRLVPSVARASAVLRGGGGTGDGGNGGGFPGPRCESDGARHGGVQGRRFSRSVDDDSAGTGGSGGERESGERGRTRMNKTW